MNTSRWTVIEADRVIDGSSPSTRDQVTVVIQDDVIRAIGHAGEIDIPADGDVTRWRLPATSTLLPGLIDTHTHLTMNGSGIPLLADAAANDGILLMQAVASAQTHLHSGVTTVVDAGARGNVAFELVEAVRLGLVQSPRLIIAGRPITRTGGHAWHMGEEADGPTDISQAARQMLKDGADVIKVMATGGGTPGTYPHRPSYRLDELTTAAEEAHENGKLAIAHCSATEGHRRCLAAGIDIIYHCHFYEADGSLRFDEEVARQLAEAPVHVNPTLWINGGRLDALKTKAKREALSVEEQHMLELRTARYAGQRENVARMVDLGVKLIAGTDAGFALYPFGDLVTELEEMVACGMSAMDVVLAATGIAAEALRIDDSVGSLAPGMKADLVIVDGKPNRNVSSLRNVQSVVLGGSVIRNDGGLLPTVTPA